MFRGKTVGLLCLATLGLLGLAGEAPAADAKAPYQLRIVLHFARHRLLTPVFQGQVERELRDGLQAALGDLAEVTVVRSHPRLGDVVARGLQRALDGWNERSAFKDHFVLVSYSGGNYEIRARQHDGLTGLSSPVVRLGRTRDREFVTKAAALLIKQDFGLVGTVTSAPDAKGLVNFELRGADLGVPLERWVKKDDVFALSYAPPGAGTGTPVPESLLQVREGPREGRCVCRLFSRYKLRKVDGLLGIQLGTIEAPLRLRLVPEGKERGSLPSLSIQIRRHGFQGEEESLVKPRVSAAGAVDTGRAGEKGRFGPAAFVSIYRGTREPVAKVPVAVVSDEPIVIKLRLKAGEGSSLFGYRVQAWQRAVSDSLRVQLALFKELERMAGKADGRTLALAAARAGLERSRDDYARLTAARDDLLSEKAPGVAAVDLSREEQQLKELQEGEKALRTFVERQEAIEKEENSPERREALRQIERGKLLEKDAEVGKALEVYKKVLDSGFKNEKLSRHYEELRKEWEVKDESLQKARTFIYDVWPTLDTAGVKNNMANASAAFKVCERNKDTIGPRKLFLGTMAHAVRMTKELAELKPDINIDDEKPAREIKELAPKLEELARDIQAYLKKTAAK